MNDLPDKPTIERRRHLSWFSDRHGKLRWRYRKGATTISIPGQPGEPGFEALYQSLIACTPERPLGSVRKDPPTSMRRKAAASHYAGPALRRAARRANAKRLDFDLTENDFIDMLVEQDWKCAVSGMEFPTRRIAVTAKERAFRPSIDRIIPSLGYRRTNVRLVCEIVNYAMHDWGEEPLRTMLLAMARTIKITTDG